MTTLLCNARLVNEGTISEQDLLIRDGRIARIDPAISAEGVDQVLDLAGKVVLPGLIDDQVHFREPGLTRRGDIASESRAAVAGGVTSVMEMPNVDPATIDRDRLADKYRLGAAKSRANYAFYFGATNHNLEAIRALKPGDACGVKVFMGASTGNLLVDDPAALEGIFAESPLLIATHCEHQPTIEAAMAEARQRYGEEIPTAAHPHIRSAEACYRSSSQAVDLARRHDARLHVLHLTTAREMALFEPGPVAGKRITAEVCVHHLHFSDADYERYGNLIKCNPAIKTAADRDALRQAVLDDRLDVIATDHAPHNLEDKQVPYLQAAAGVPLVQHSLLMLLEHYHAGRFSLELIARKTAHAVADAFAVQERGYLREGYWADLTVVDLDQPTHVTAESLFYKCGWSPFVGETFRSSVHATFVNGDLAWHQGKLHDDVRGQALVIGTQR